MRDIKFRAWDKEQKCWFKPTYEAYKGNLADLMIGLYGDLFMHTMKGVNHESLFPDRFELMQWTELRDKNDREIYEGDILQFSNKAEWYGGMDQEQLDKLPFKRGVVEWDSKEGCWKWGFGTHSDLHRFIEVVGNIYEHSHLLKDDDEGDEEQYRLSKKLEGSL